MKNNHQQSNLYNRIVIRMLSITTALLMFLCGEISAQNLDVDGNVKITEINADTMSTDIVVSGPDSILSIQDVTSIICPTSRINHPTLYLGKDTLGGIVFYIYIGADSLVHGLIVSKSENGSARWQVTPTVTGAVRTWDGQFNMALMTDSPAKDWVTTNFGTEWYLPSTDELTYLFHNRFRVNKAMHDGGFTLITRIGEYWTSTERNSTEASMYRFSEGDVLINIGKTSLRRVRAIRSF